MAHDSPSASDTILRIVTGFTSAQVIHVAVQLGLADLLADGPRSVADLATATGTHAPSLRRLVRALAAIGVVAETEDGSIELTSLGTPLRFDVPDSVRDAVLFLAGEWFWGAWGGLLDSVRTGEPAFDRVFGMSNFAYWEHDPVAASIHDAFFTAMARTTTEPIVAAYDFSRFATIVDVGGSTGSLLAAILNANAGVRGILFDLPHVVTEAARVLTEAGVADRCEVVGGDFFTANLPSGDAYILKYIIHDWDDARALAILIRCREAMSPGGVVLIIEQVLPECLETGPVAQRTARLDLQMLVLTPGGRERTEQQYRSLLEQAGFELRRLVPTQSPFSIMEGVAR